VQNQSDITADRTIAGFRARHSMSKAGYYRLPKEVRAKLETVYGPRTIRILPKAEAAFDRAHSKPNSTEQRLVAKMRAKLTVTAKKAAAAAVKSPRHVSKRRSKLR
jgi:hypothetical protein